MNVANMKMIEQCNLLKYKDNFELKIALGKVIQSKRVGRKYNEKEAGQ
ncbi:hypothetical protein ACIQ4Z_14865 [Peribacillus asahii]